MALHQLIETAYQLASRDDAETLEILDKVIVLLVHANPDGHELVADWYMREPVPEQRSLSHLRGCTINMPDMTTTGTFLCSI